MKQTNKRTGRPPKHTGKGGLVSIGGRVTAELKERFEASARRSGRSLSRELELRLSQSFDLEERLGDPELAAIVNLMAGAFVLAGRRQAVDAGHPDWPTSQWMRDPICYMAAKHAVVDVLETTDPAVGQNEAADKATWARDAALRAEFGDSEAAWLAYGAGVRSGRIRKNGRPIRAVGKGDDAA